VAGAELARAQLATAAIELAHAQLTFHPHSVETCHGLLHRSGVLRATDELYTDKLHTPTSLHYL
jgi:hypothetical protein